MRWLLFLSRLAFISGICVLAWQALALFRQQKQVDQNAVVSTIIVIGCGIGVVVIPVTNLLYLVLTVARQKIRRVVPGWLLVANIFWLFLLLFYFFYLNDPYYSKQ